MKKDLKMPAVANSHFRNLILICLLFIYLAGFFSCWDHHHPSWRTYIRLDSTYENVPPNPYKQLIVLRKTGTSDDDYSAWIDDSIHKRGDVNITIMCQTCDEKLMLLTGPGVETYIQGKTAGGGSGCGGTQCGPSGEDGPVYYSINFGVYFNDHDTIYTAKSPITPAPSKKAITVAVFDTGVDSFGLEKYFYKNDAISSCLGVLADNGWNFAYHNNNWADDYPTKHGTKVTSFVVDQIQKFAGDSVKILPVKIHNSNGVSDLFSVLCGFAYAVDRHVQIINASFGYYAPKPILSTSDPDTCALLLKEYVRTYLTKNNILLVAAAGNSSVIEDNDTTLKVSTALGRRSLDSVHFYPASLAGNPDFSNVIAVTTIDTVSHSVSPIQNFSPNVVDIGVQADLVIDSFYVFIPPNAPVGSATVSGSSFATPIATGIICANYYLLTPGTSNKAAILDALSRQHLAYSNSSFGNLIRNGTIMARKK